MLRRVPSVFLLVATLLFASLGQCEQVYAAVAANFATTIDRLAVAFEASSQHDLLVSKGSTGKLYAQIRNGAPFDVFLAADHQRPNLLAQDGVGIRGSQFTYAFGILAVVGAQQCKPLVHVLDGARRIAIANPNLAPYGVATKQALQRVDRWEPVQRKVVIGENVGQAHVMFSTGNTDLAFIALAQARHTSTRACRVDRSLYAPIRQDAIQINATQGARDFLAFLKSSAAKEMIRDTGYNVE